MSKCSGGTTGGNLRPPVNTRRRRGDNALAAPCNFILFLKK